MVSAASKALAERAERARSKFSAKASKMSKHLHFCSRLKISKIAWLPRAPDPKTPFGGANLPKAQNSSKCSVSQNPRGRLW